MKLKILTLLLVFYASALYSQVAVSYYPFQSILSVSSNTEKLFWVDYKIETNTFILNLNMELSPKFNLKRSERVNYYVGPGISFNFTNATADLPLTNGYFIDTGVRIKPIKKYKNIQLVFEISPYINSEFSGGNLRTRLGISYNFNRETTK
ncbi:MAG TPA: hypothetical protein VIK14_06165 [Ignavibacteria bacterium]|jgi:hypothetical protein